MTDKTRNDELLVTDINITVLQYGAEQLSSISSGEDNVIINYKVSLGSAYSFLFPSNRGADKTVFILEKIKINKLSNALLNYLNNQEIEHDLIDFQEALSIEYILTEIFAEAARTSYAMVDEIIWFDDFEFDVKLLTKIFNIISIEYGDSRRIHIPRGESSHSFL